MPRDDELRSNSVPRTARFQPSGAVNVTNGTNHVEDRSRALPVSTNPAPGGEYYLPTSYKAHKWYNTGAYLDYQTKNSLGNTIDITGLSRTGDFAWPLRTWGLNTASRPYSVSMPLSVIARAELQAMASLKKGTNLAVTVAELSKTLLTITKILRLLRAIIRGYRPRLLDDGDIADFWLLYRYFFQTSMMDIYGLMEGVQNLINKPEFLVGEAQVVDPDFAIWTTAPTNWWMHEAKGNFRRGCNVKLTARVTNPTLYALDAFGVLNPAVFAWELIPFSFVIDWFISIGPWLASLTAPFGMSFSCGYKTLWLKYSYNITYIPTSKVVNTTLTVRSPGQLTGGMDAFTRIPYGAFPQPFVSIDCRLSAKQVLDALALLVGAGRPGRELKRV